jgi:hypothetical protein
LGGRFFANSLRECAPSMVRCGIRIVWYGDRAVPRTAETRTTKNVIWGKTP